MHLVIRDLSKTYPNGTRALKDVSLDVPQGMFGLLGRNGAGKSTLMRIIATLQEPDEGMITLGDLDVLRQKGEVRKTLGYLPQSFGFHPKAKAQRLLEHFAILKGIEEPGMRRDVVEALLRQTNLWDVRGEKLGTFSGGMRQRFGVAVALLGNPKLIIVDEPTAGLDPEERVRFLNLLSQIGEDSVVILSTHIVEDVEELCSRMAIIDQGEILLEAEPLGAMAELQGRIWRRMVSREELEALEREMPVISTKLLAGRTIVHVYAESSPLYVGVLAIGFIGAIIARLQPRGLARALFATALAQALVGGLALKLPNTAGSVQILILHGAFVVLFAGAALLFRYAAQKGFIHRGRVFPVP